jgi:hypothetical protein
VTKKGNKENKRSGSRGFYEKLTEAAIKKTAHDQGRETHITSEKGKKQILITAPTSEAKAKSRTRFADDDDIKGGEPPYTSPCVIKGKIPTQWAC